MPSLGYDVQLAAVSGVAANDVWIAGSSSTSGQLPLALHWNGDRLANVPITDVAGGAFRGIVALSANDAWAVGDAIQPAGSLGPAIEHWDGRRWRGTLIDGAPTSGRFNAISADAPNDVWAVGENDETYGAALVAHYDGHTWQIVPSLSDPQIDTPLIAVAAISSRDVWAAGAIGGASSDVTVARKIIEHWDGHAWRFVADAADPVDSLPTLSAMAARAASDVWAVGFHFAEHWNGRKWQRVPLPAGDGVGGVAAAGPALAWIAGGGSVPGSSKSVPIVDFVSATPCVP